MSTMEGEISMYFFCPQFLFFLFFLQLSPLKFLSTQEHASNYKFHYPTNMCQF